MSGDAGAVPALELIRPTRDVVAAGHTLVTSTGTVLVPVTHPRLVYAGQSVLALELAGQAMRRVRWSVCAAYFIRAVVTVRVAVAPPSGCDAEVL